MLANIPILSIIAFSPLVGILVLLFLKSEQGRAIRITGTVFAAIPLLLSLWVYGAFDQGSGKMQFVENATWIHLPLNHEGPAISGLTAYFFEMKYKLGVDGVSLALVVMTALIAVMACFASVYIKKRWKLFFSLSLLLETGMLGVFMARDLLLFFIFFEVTLIPTFFLIAIWGYRDREKAANKFLIYNGIGSAIMLVAFLALISTAGVTVQQTADTASISYTSDLDQIEANLHDPQSLANAGMMIGSQLPNPFNEASNLKWAILLMLVVAFGIKLPIFPFHTWMLKVHAEAPPSTVMIHSGILLKMGAYGLLRFGVLLFPDQAKSMALALAILGAVNIIYGAVLAFRQSEFKLVLAYSSISHMGVILLGIAAFNVIGIEGAVFQMVSHGLISALMFLLVGSLYERTESTKLDDLGGLAKSMPFIAGILLIAGLASLGLPGLSGFISEFLAFLGLFHAQTAVTIVSALGIILSAVYVLRAILNITFGPMRTAFGSLKDARLAEAVPMIILAAFIVLIGVYPGVLNDPLKATVDTMLQTFSMKVGG